MIFFLNQHVKAAGVIGIGLLVTKNAETLLLKKNVLNSMIVFGEKCFVLKINVKITTLNLVASKLIYFAFGF